jgi:hypothetical protein
MSTTKPLILFHKVILLDSVNDPNPYLYGVYDNLQSAQLVADDWNVIYQNAQNGFIAKVEQY